MNYLSRRAISLTIVCGVLLVTTLVLYRAEPGYMYNNMMKLLYYLITALLMVVTVSLTTGCILTAYDGIVKKRRTL
jgi:hypothetical protein